MGAVTHDGNKQKVTEIFAKFGRICG